MTDKQQTLQEMADHWRAKKAEAETALQHISALMKIEGGEARKRRAQLLGSKSKGIKKRRIKQTGEDYILEILKGADEPLSATEIGHAMHKEGQQRTRQAINRALRLLVESNKIVEVHAPVGASARKLFRPSLAKGLAALLPPTP